MAELGLKAFILGNASIDKDGVVVDQGQFTHGHLNDFGLRPFQIS